MSTLLTAREVQDRLKVDRTTVYRMLKDGRLSGVKVGQQWRFPSAEVDALLSPEPAPTRRPAEVLPLHCIQPIQDVFAEVAGVMALLVDPRGAPLTEPSGPGGLYELLRSTPAGAQICAATWRALAAAPAGAYQAGYAGLDFAAAPIRIDGELVALLVAGEFHARPAGPTARAAGLASLARSSGLAADRLAAAAARAPTLDERARGLLGTWLSRVATTFETIAHERAALLGRLRRIAEMTVLENA